MSYGKPEYDPLLDAYKCEICAKYYENLHTHVRVHGLNNQEYRKKFGLVRCAVLIGKKARDKMRQSAIQKNKIQYLAEIRKLTTFKKNNKAASKEARKQRVNRKRGQKAHKPEPSLFNSKEYF